MREMLSEGFQALALTLQEAATSVSHSDLRTQLHAAIRAKHPTQYPYLLDVFGDENAGDVVFQMGDKYNRAPYTIAKSGNQAGSTATTTIGAHHEVTPRTVYHKVKGATESAKESELEVSGEFVSLKEGAVEKDGRVLVKLIAPGWGSSGHYGKEMLKRDLPKAFRKGTKMYWNHQTAAEEAARPEGNLDDVASILAEDAKYDENGPLGPGGYAYADTVEHYRPAIENLSKHMGVSIRARGTAQEGEAEGRKGPIINSLTHGISVDYVTEAGAGGKVVSLFEAARPQKIRESRKEENDMDKTEVQALIEAAVTPLNATLTKANGENLKLRQRLAVTEAAGVADGILATLSLHEGVRARVKSRVLGGVIPLTEAGELDATKLKELLEAEAKDESAYIAKLTEGKQVVNMGAPIEKPADLTEAEYEKQMVASFMESGMSEAAAKVAAKGAVN